MDDSTRLAIWAAVCYSRRAMVAALLTFLLLLCSGSAWGVPLLEVDGPIGPVTAEYVSEALEDVATRREPLVLLRVDTPGGLDASMRRIVQAILASPVPVVAWVGPSGARAASAGLFVVAAAHVAAMAPGTSIGAAHPVNLGGGKADDVSLRKAEQDAAAYARSLALQRGRDPRWFASAVEQSASLAAEEAEKGGVVDVLASEATELLTALEGRAARVAGHAVTLKTAGLTLQPVPFTFRQKILRILAEPNAAYLLLMLGFYGLFFELATPGAVLPGVLGGLCLILAFVGLQTLPFSYAGILLILLGLLLFLLEVKITSYGLLAVGGVTSLTLGSLLLFRSAASYYRLSVGVVLPVVAATTLLFVFLVGKGLAAQRGRPVSGLEGLVGARAVAREDLVPGVRGRVFVHGESWAATSSAAIQAGSEFEVLAVEGMELRVGPGQGPGPERRQ